MSKKVKLLQAGYEIPEKAVTLSLLSGEKFVHFGASLQ